MRLPRCYWCYSAPPLGGRLRRSASPGRRRSVASTISRRSPTRRSALWVELLRRVPEARLLVYARGGEPSRARARAHCARRASTKSRVAFVGWQTSADYLRDLSQHRRRARPVPVCRRHDDVRCAVDGRAGRQPRGSTAVSRAGSTLLSNVGLERARCAKRGAVPRARGRLAAATARGALRYAATCARNSNARPSWMRSSSRAAWRPPIGPCGAPGAQRTAVS